jgi:RHS repeat-associated protein
MSSILSTLRRLSIAITWFGMLVLACRGEQPPDDGTDDFRGGVAPPNLGAHVEALRASGITIAASSEVGTLPGGGYVGPTGQAGYSIPIEVPPGAGGLAPAFSLQYSSGEGNGLFGVGWGLSGLSTIDRCPRTIAEDGAHAPVRLDAKDAVCLDGQRLVLVAGTHLQPGAEYRTKRDPFARISIKVYESRPYFEVEGADGRISDYGRRYALEESGTRYQWLLDRVRNRFDHEVEYWYVSDGGSESLRLARVSWDGGRIDLVPDPAGREDERRGYESGVFWEQLDRIQAIEVSGLGGELLHRYVLGYEYAGVFEVPEPWQSLTRSLLTSIQKCDAAGACLPATTFSYAGSSGGLVAPTEDLPGLPDGLEGLTPAQIEELEWNKRSLAGDFNGDIEYETIVLSPTSAEVFRPGSSGGTWVSDLGIGTLPPSFEEIARQFDAGVIGPLGYAPDDWALHRVQPAMGHQIINYDNDRRDDILIPVEGGRDAWGVGYAESLRIATAGSDFTDPQVGYLSFSYVDVDDLSTDPIYNVVPVDHDGNGLTDLWLCRGQGFKTSHWVLALNQGDTGFFTFSFHDSNVGCSVHDELNVLPLRGGPDSLLVVPAYEWQSDEMIYPDPGLPPQAYLNQVLPLEEATRTHYLELQFDPSSGEDGVLVTTELPRDLFQRWRDRECHNELAAAELGFPAFGAGLGLDRQVDLNGDGYVDILRAELAVEPAGFPAGSTDTQANIDAIRTNLGADDAWFRGITCDTYDPLVDHEDVVLRGWINTGDGFERGDAIYHFAGNPHANLWANIHGGQLTDRDRDGYPDLLVPSTGPGEDWTFLKASGDVFDCAGGNCYTAEPIELPSGWPGYRSDGSWRSAVERAAVVQIRGIGSLAFEGAVYEGGSVEREVAYLGYEATHSTGVRLTAATDGLGGAHAFVYDCANAVATPYQARPKTSPRTCIPVVTRHTQPGGLYFTYEYRGAVVDQHGRGFLGFEQVTTTESGTLDVQQQTVTTFDFSYDPVLRDYPRAGVPARTRVSRTVRSWPPQNDLDVECTDVDDLEVVTSPELGGTTWFSYPRETHTYAKTFSTSYPWASFDDAPPCHELDSALARESFSTQVLSAEGAVTFASSSTVGGEERSVNPSSFVNDEASWFMGRPRRIEVESCVDDVCQTRTTAISYDASTHSVTSITREPNEMATTLRQATTFQYVAGRVGTTTVSDSFGNIRQSTVTWDSLGRLPRSVENAEGHVSYFVHDEASGALWATVDADGLTSIAEVDGFYRPVETRVHDQPLGPDEGRTTIEYLAGAEPFFGAPGAVMRVRTRRYPIGQQVTFEIDSAGREIRRRWKAAEETSSFPIDLPSQPDFSGDDVYVSTVYDERHRPTAVSHPQFAPNPPDYYTLTEWDTFDRPVSRTITPASGGGTGYAAFESWRYVHAAYELGGASGPIFIEHTDLDGKTSATLLNADGRVAVTRDALGTLTCFDYAPFGVLESVHRNCGGAGGPSTTTTYVPDKLGRILEETDPAFGTVTTTYTGFDEVDVVTDAMGIVIDTDYDDLGRPIARDENGEGVTTWDWDTDRIGQLYESASVDGITRRYFYGGFRRLLEARTIAPTAPDGTTARTMSEFFGYSGDGRLTRIEFDAQGKDPNFRIEFSYDKFANLRSVHNATDGALFWGAVEFTAAGQIARERYGNGVYTRKSYFTDSLRPETIETYIPQLPPDPATILQSFHYEWTDAGDLSRREETDAVPDQVETFTYDDLHRLTNWRPNGGSQSASYDVLGNVLSKSGSGTFTYDTAGRLATTNNGSITYSFLPNGNLSTWGSKSLTWTPLDKVRTLTTASESLAFRYDADGVRTYRTDGDLVHVTASELFERRIDGAWPVIHYRIPTADGRIAAEVKFEPTWCDENDNCSWTSTTTYVHDDHLGSGTLQTDGSGGVKGSVSYDPWGRPRKPDNWKELVAETAADQMVSGFTGHDADTEGGLINMRGRMYDPKIGRFASTDPIVSDPLSAQGWNAYSYVGNRPLTFTDPSGYFGIEPTQEGPWGGTKGAGIGWMGRGCSGCGGGTGNAAIDGWLGGMQVRGLVRMINAGFAGLGGSGQAFGFNGLGNGGSGIAYPLTGGGNVRSGGGGSYHTLMAVHLAYSALLGFEGGQRYKAATDHIASYLGGTDPEIPKLNGWVEDVLYWGSFVLAPGFGELGVQVFEYGIGVAPAPTALDAALLLVPGRLGKLGRAFKPFTRSHFRHNLIALTGRNPGPRSQAHHVLPQAFEEYFQAAGINIHHPRFGAWWGKKDHGRKAAEYNEAWREFIRMSPDASADDIVSFGRQIAGSYGLTILF